MSAGLLASLACLALLDSTSIGTLVIPVWLLLSQDRRRQPALAPGGIKVARLVAYLATIAIFYAIVGVLVVSGAGIVAEPLGRALDTTAANYVQLGLGVALFAWSFRFDPKRRRANGTGRVERWRARVTEGSASPGWLVGLALTAGVMEVATMLPYLAAIGLITASGIPWPVAGALLGGYCLVMVLPALALTAARVVVASRVDPLLVRLNAWMTRHAAGATGWVLAIAGFLVARDAVARLWF